MPLFKWQCKVIQMSYWNQDNSFLFVHSLCIYKREYKYTMMYLYYARTRVCVYKLGERNNIHTVSHPKAQEMGEPGKAEKGNCQEWDTKWHSIFIFHQITKSPMFLIYILKIREWSQTQEMLTHCSWCAFLFLNGRWEPTSAKASTQILTVFWYVWWLSDGPRRKVLLGHDLHC